MEELRKRVESLVRAGYPALALLTHEEERTVRMLREVSNGLGRRSYLWSVARGWHTEDGTINLETGSLQIADADGPARSFGAGDALDEIQATCRHRKAVFMFKDLHEFLRKPVVVRKLLDVLHSDEDWTVVLVAPSIELPSLLEKEVTVLDVPLPDVVELREVLIGHLRELAKEKGGVYPVPKGLIERVLKAALGLTERQADCVFRRAICEDREFDETDLDLIAEEKRQVIHRTGVMEYCRHDETLGHVGGLDALKGWLKLRRSAFSEKARAYGLPEPKGLFLLGVQGCGKSLVSKAIAAYWRIPLMRLDVGALFSKYIGQTEENLRTALRVSESVAPAVLWLDEIEKGFSGVTGGGHSDAGTTVRIFGTFLTWMQEKAKPVFVVATANSIDYLPPELLRKGRFDEIFFVDLPNEREREAIFHIHLERKDRAPADYDIAKLAESSDGFSGAEIEQAVVDAMYTAFPERREFTTDDIVQALERTVSLSESQREKVSALRSWAKGRARWATERD
jgi:AAA+ superfamily predicted ATPase